MKTTHQLRAAATVVALTATLGLTACGGDETPKAKDAWNKAQDGLAKHSSFTVTGKGKDKQGKDMQMSMSGDTKGTAYTASLTEGSGKVNLLEAGGKQYVKGNKAYYESNDGSASSSLAAKVADQWIINEKGDDESPIKKMTQDICDDNDTLNKQLLSDKATVKADTVDGKDAWKITGADKKSIAWVSKDDKYDILKVQGMDKSDDRLTSASFTDYDKNFNIKAPANAKSAKDIAMGN